MAAEQTTAIVLRTIEFSETSLIVTLLSRDFGQMAAIAKGARRPKGPFEGSLDLLAVCRVVVIRKNADALDLLTEAKLQKRFRGAERSLQQLYAGYYIAEMLRLLTDKHDPHPDVYDLAIATLAQIDCGLKKPATTIAAAMLFFDAQILRMLGHAPSTTTCTGCDKIVPRTKRMAFALIGGGVVCNACRSREHQTLSVSCDSIDELQRLLSTDVRFPLSVDATVYGELRAVMNRYFQALLGTQPRMQSFLPTAIRKEPNA
ncbi:DNA repair protein RecO [Planctomycetes bacterium K23_9]|uniref:DNA repair protein RecO n=1 Tax=Stieleria marina TaxID=1930275 RepID=A0A517NR18_9BACT|nr:DNA repair protein RecO [Planctomycetes bacterium K23_9]